MSTLEAALIALGVMTPGLAVIPWLVRRARRADAKRDQILRETCEYDGPVSPTDPRLPSGINAHLDDYAALDLDLAPVFAPGVDRLWQAIRDEQQKGEL